MNFSFLGQWVNPWRAYLAEFLGTFVFVLIASGAVLSNVFYSEIGTLGIALATGLSITSMMYATVHISGAHLNPAVTVALWLAQKIKGSSAFFYVIAQIFASFAAAAVVLLIFGNSAKEFVLGGPSVGASVSQQTALVIESILTAVLVFATACGVIYYAHIIRPFRYQEVENNYKNISLTTNYSSASSNEYREAMKMKKRQP